MQPFDMRKFMEERARTASSHPATPNAPESPAAPVPGIPVRAFREEGLRRAAELLREMRERKTILADAVRELVAAPEYSDIVPNFTVDPKRVFADKQDMCEYLLGVFSRNYVAANRNNRGLWTWLAFAYFDQFARRMKGDTIRIATDARWIYTPDIYRLARRHFVAGTLYLYADSASRDRVVDDVLFSGSVAEISRFFDVLTYLPDCARNPAFVRTAIALYYDPAKKSKVRTMTFDESRKDSLWQYLRVFRQYNLTNDFFDEGDSAKLISILPGAFTPLRQNLNGWSEGSRV